jgi:hypothetical protein
MSDRIKGKIAAILSKTEVVINRGEDDGVTRGAIFYVYSLIGPILDPDTGEELGEIPRIWGEIEVSVVEDRFSVAKTRYKTVESPLNILAKSPSYLDLFSGLQMQVQEELPVDRDEIARFEPRIRVGSPVISAKRISPEHEDSQAQPGSARSGDSIENLDKD